MAKRTGLKTTATTTETSGSSGDNAPKPATGRGSRGPRKQKADPKRITLLLSEDATKKVLALARAFGAWGTALPEPDGTSLQERLTAMYETKAFLPHLHILRGDLQEAKDLELQNALAEVFDEGSGSADDTLPVRPDDIVTFGQEPVGEFEG